MKGKIKENYNAKYVTRFLVSFLFFFVFFFPTIQRNGETAVSVTQHMIYDLQRLTLLQRAEILGVTIL